MKLTRRAFTAALSLTGFAALAGLSPWRFIGEAMAQSQLAADVAKPQSLPDMAERGVSQLMSVDLDDAVKILDQNVA